MALTSCEWLLATRLCQSTQFITLGLYGRHWLCTVSEWLTVSYQFNPLDKLFPPCMIYCTTQIGGDFYFLLFSEKLLLYSLSRALSDPLCSFLCVLPSLLFLLPLPSPALCVTMALMAIYFLLTIPHWSSFTHARWEWKLLDIFHEPWPLAQIQEAQRLNVANSHLER